MKVVLLEKIHQLGELGETVQVKPGYGRNFLIPKGKAAPATEENLAKFEARRAELEKAAVDKLAIAQKRADKLKDVAVSLVRKTVDETRLFGSIGVKEVIDELIAKGLEVEKREIHLPIGTIRELGDYDVEVHLHPDLIAIIKVKVEAE